MDSALMMPLAFGAGIVSLAFAAFLIFSILRKPAGSDKMKEIAKAIQEGAQAYLMRQYKTLVLFVVLLAALIGWLLNVQTAIAFLGGVLCSALAGYVGMMVSVRANVRTAEAAKSGLAPALGLAFRGGAVTGFTLVGLGLLGVTILYSLYANLEVLIGFGFGASLISLFARVGGGIYTKAADVGADLVGKVEKGIPEDDPRNPAVIADNVGDNVGDCAGMAADLFESYAVTIIAAMLLGGIAASTLGGVGGVLEYVMLPLGIAAVGAIAAMIGLFFVRLGKSKNIMHALYKGVIVSAVLSAVGFYFLTAPDLSLFFTSLIGVAVTLLMFLITEYYTAKEHRPVQWVAESSRTGAGTNLIAGLAIGLESTLLPVLVIVAAIAASYSLAGIYGIALAATAMLSATAMVIALDAYGPITDNAGGIAEMSGLPANVRKVTDELDSVGNTTKATTKGFAIAGAALGALALFAAFAEATKLTSINILQPAVVIGLFLGGVLPFLFASLLMRAVGTAAFEIVEEVRRQFRQIKGLMSGKGRPDYARCVDLATAGALKQLMIPGILAVFSPIVVGYLFGVEALGGLLAGSIVSGFLLALMMATSGATWDNAKKYVEDGHFGGKGSDTHKAAVVGDTVGDPFKDTAGPSLNALIKVLNTVSLVFAGVLLTYA
ncbi:sodium-translocating pyrophosphatase, partial [Candidatus Micrarchaeota archaeon]|nr:sodium-translocating pyrophosphatase [Candidatus Micrarchaeota archaeon]